MAIIDLVMPKMGESIMEATILKWNKNVGDSIKMDETLLEIATDKVDSEVPSTAEGIIAELLFKVNDVVPVGKIIAKINTENSNSPAPTTQEIVIEKPAPQANIIAQKTAQPTSQIQSNSNKFYSPLVLNIASAEGVSMQELEAIAGSGNEGRVTKKDIINFVSSRASSNHTSSNISPANVIPTTPTTTPISAIQQSGNNNGNVEIIEMDRMRKLIAEHMVKSKATSPHVTSFTEADVTNIVN